MLHLRASLFDNAGHHGHVCSSICSSPSVCSPHVGLVSQYQAWGRVKETIQTFGYSVLHHSFLRFYQILLSLF